MAAHPGPRTLAEKVWDSHVVVPGENGKPASRPRSHLTPGV